MIDGKKATIEILETTVKNNEDRNKIDFQEIELLKEKYKNLLKAINQKDLINSKIVDKLKKEYEKLEKIIIDENIQIELSKKDNELLNEIINNSIKIKNVNNNTRKFKKPFSHCVDWSDRSNGGTNETKENIINKINDMKKYKIEELSVTIQTKCENNVVILVTDLKLFKECLDYAKTLNIDTAMIKVHCNEFRTTLANTTDETIRDDLFTQWKEMIINIATYFKGYCNYFIPINEGEHIFLQTKYETFLNECLDICQNLGFKSGYSTTNLGQWDGLPESIRNKCDFVSVNYYPCVSLKGLETTYEDVINSYEREHLNSWIKRHKVVYNIPVFITETGCEDRISCLASTYVWDFGNDEGFNNGAIQNIMLKGIFEYFKDNECLDKIFYWYPFRGDNVLNSINEYLGGE